MTPEQKAAVEAAIETASRRSTGNDILTAVGMIRASALTMTQLADAIEETVKHNQAARRPKPPNLKEQALHALLHMDQGQHNELTLIIRSALEQLPD